MQNQKVLEQLGYSSKEAEIYLASLAMGEAHICDITEKVHMPRSTVQTIVERLHEDGLMNFYVIRRHKYWVAEGPSVLLKKLERQKQLVEEVVPNLTALRQKARANNKIHKLQEEDLGPLSEVADGMAQPVLIANTEAEIQYTNDAWCNQFQYTSEEVFGQSTRILKSGQTPSSEYERLWRTVKSGKIFQSNQIVDQSKDGRFFSFKTVIFPVVYGNRTFYVQILEEQLPEAIPANLQQLFADVSTR